MHIRWTITSLLLSSVRYSRVELLKAEGSNGPSESPQSGSTFDAQKSNLPLKLERGFRDQSKCGAELGRRKLNSAPFKNKGSNFCNGSVISLAQPELGVGKTPYSRTMSEGKKDFVFVGEGAAGLDTLRSRHNVNDISAPEISRMAKREAEDYYDLNETNYIDGNRTVSDEDYMDSIRDFIFPKTWTWVLIFFHSAVFVIGLVGNTLVCVAVYRNHTMRTVTNYFIVNLAVADFLVILVCLPPSVIWDVTMTWFLGVALCKIVLYLQTVSVTVSVLTLTFISVDRWYAICFPLKFKSTTGRAKTAIGIIWLLALTFDIPELVVYRTAANEKIKIETIYFTQCEPSWSTETDRTWMILKMVLLYAIPLMFMSVAYCQIIRVLWKSGNVHQHSLDVSGGRQVNTFTMNTNTSTEGQLRSRRKAAKMLVAVVIMFAVCYFPVHLLSVLRMSMKNTDTNRAFFLISHWLCYANSAVNPIIYNFMSGKFRKEFRRAFEHCCQPSPNANNGYQLSNLSKNTDKDSGIGSRTQSRSSKRTLAEVRRLGTIDSQLTDNDGSRRQSKQSVVSKIDV